MQAKLQEIKAELRLRMHQTIPDQGHWLKQVVTGHFAYYAVPTNSRSLSAFRHYVTDLWRRTLRRRGQKDGFTWDRIRKLADDWLPAPHPSSLARSALRRQTPKVGAGCSNWARPDLCGGVQQWASLPRSWPHCCHHLQQSRRVSVGRKQTSPDLRH